MYKKGLFEVQDEASQIVADHVEVQPGDLVLDYCAGGGGKTLAFAHRMKGKGQIFMTDTRYAPKANGEGSKLVSEAKERLRRAGIQNAQQLVPDHPHLTEHLRGKFDWILLDVPCSGTGTMRRHPELKYKYMDLSALRELVQLQREIVDAAVPFLKLNGGHLVYSTCSVLQEENMF
jgi:16S rRNA (cytosine967-C5)-methyltransferase